MAHHDAAARCGPLPDPTLASASLSSRGKQSRRTCNLGSALLSDKGKLDVKCSQPLPVDFVFLTKNNNGLPLFLCSVVSSSL